MSTFQNGALIDTRPAEAKLRDFTFEEIVASASSVDWQEKPETSWRKFPIFNQDGSGSCVAQTESKEMGIMKWLKDGVYVHFSATHIYQRRVNKTSSGMGAVDCRAIASQGVTLEVLAPSQNMTDEQMDAVKIESYKQDVGKVFAVPNYLEITTKDIDLVASVIQKTGKGVMVWFYFETREWTERPKVLNPNLTLEEANRHSVTAVDFTLINGKKCLIIEDSWGTSYGLAGQRVIDEDFFNARNWYRSYLMTFKFDEQVTPKPRYTFTKPLKFGDQNDDVRALQDILRYEGFFPSNTASTGYFGGVTANGVYKWQVKHAVAPLSELDSIVPKGGLFGNKSIIESNKLYK